MHEQLSRVASDPALEPADKTAALSDLRERLRDLLGACDRLLSDAHRARERGASQAARERFAARGAADARTGLIQEGHDPLELDEAAVLSHETLDELEEEGLAGEAARAVARATRPGR
jgi:hypothetical protein